MRHGHNLQYLPVLPLLVFCTRCGLTLEWSNEGSGGWSIIAPIDIPDCVPNKDDDRTDDYGFTIRT